MLFDKKYKYKFLLQKICFLEDRDCKFVNKKMSIYRHKHVELKQHQTHIVVAEQICLNADSCITLVLVIITADNTKCIYLFYY